MRKRDEKIEWVAKVYGEGRCVAKRMYAIHCFICASSHSTPQPHERSANAIASKWRRKYSSHVITGCLFSLGHSESFFLQHIFLLRTLLLPIRSFHRCFSFPWPHRLSASPAPFPHLSAAIVYRLGH